MNDLLRILLLEDIPIDAELNERMLRKAGINFTSLRVDTLETYIKALDEFKPDVILADFNLPGFNGMQALKIMKERPHHIPFIVVSGAIGEERAVDTIKEGATDYVFKDRLARLPNAVLHAMEEENLQKDRREAEDRFHTIFVKALDGIVLMDESGLIVDCNPEFERQTGRNLETLRKMHIWELRPLEKIEPARKKFQEILNSGEGGANDLEFQKPDGSMVSVEFRAARIAIGDKLYLQSITRDITARNEAQAKLVHSENSLKEAQQIALLGSWELDIESNVLNWSDEIYRIFEINPMQFGASYNAFLDAIHPEDREAVNNAYLESVKSHKPYDIVHRLLMHDGRIKYVHEICKTTYDEQGKPVQSKGTVQDITLQHEAEENIHRLNRTLRTISACNQSLVRARSEDELISEVCRYIVLIGGYMLAEVAYTTDIQEPSCRSVSHYGDEKIFQKHLELSNSPEHTKRCLTNAAVRLRLPAVCNKLMETSEFTLDKHLQKIGVNAVLALPLPGGNAPYGALTIFSNNMVAFDESEVKLMEELAANIAYGITALRTTHERDEYLVRFGASMKNTVAAIARTLEMRDLYTAGHQLRVAHLALAIAEEMGLSAEQSEGIHLAGIVHDIGKIHIPAEILVKPGKLSDLEYNFIKTHSQSGYDILKDIEFPWPIAQMVLQHHERLDGSGYPQALTGDSIMLESHILIVADVVEAMASHRPYRPSLGVERALTEISSQRGTRFHSGVVDACLILFREKNYTISEK